MSSKTAMLLNGMYAVARKKSELNHQEKELVKTAAQMLEQALRKVEAQKAQMVELQERIAIMLEGSGKLKDDGGGFPPKDDGLPEEGSWDDGWPIVGYPTR